MSKLIVMFLEFFKIGLFAVGGGLATIPFLNELATKTNWFSMEELATMIAVSESTPGAMGVNMATYVGYSQMGVLGAVVVTLGLVTPSIIVICCIARMLEKFKNAKIITQIFSGLKPAVVAFIAVATVDILITSLFVSGKQYTSIDLKSLLLLIVLFVLYKFNAKMHPIFIISVSAMVGIIFSL